MSPSTSRRSFLHTAAAGAAVASAPAWAQTPWPAKPVRIIVPYTAGGFTDQMARMLQVGLQKALGQPIVIENKPGANSIIGVDQVAKSAPDGLTFGVVIAAFAGNTTLYDKLPYHPTKDIVGVSLMGVSPLVAAVSLNAPFKNAQELVAYARANPGKVSFASSGSGSSAHLTTELLKLLTKTDMVHVPYRGTAPAVNDLVAGQIQVLFTGAPAVLPFVKSGQMRALAVSSSKRLDALPDVPTVAESGYKGFEADQWYGIMAPTGTPREIVLKLNAQINSALGTSEMKTRLQTEGAIGMPRSPEVFGELITSELARWRPVVQAGRIKPD